MTEHTPTLPSADADLAVPAPAATAATPLPGAAIAALGAAMLAVAGGLFLLGWGPHVHEIAAAEAIADRARTEAPVVEVIAPVPGAATVDLELPGDVRPDRNTSIYARVSGYLDSLGPGIDIGADVHAGQVLAEIAVPEVAADLAKARADLAQAEASRRRAHDDLVFAEASFERYQGFAADGGLTAEQLAERKQQLDNARSGTASAEASVAGATAARDRLEQLVAFAHVTAPFDGVVTFRGYDKGSMISASDVAAGKELFRVVAAQVVRVRVAVPQAYAGSIVVGQSAELVLRDGPGHALPGQIARLARVVDPETRTMTVEIEIPNREGAIVPGTYGTVRLHVRRGNPGWLLPASALVVGGDGTRIAVVVDGHVQLRPVVIDGDEGSSVRLTAGVDGGERVIDNPGPRITDGMAVEVRERARSTEARR